MDDTLDSNDWIFPEVDVGVDSQPFCESDYFTNMDANGNPIPTTVNNPPIPEPLEETLEEKALKLAQQEAQQMKIQYEEKFQILINIMNQVKTPVALVEGELVEYLLEMIKKISKRIILKEIISDPNLLIQMINELKTLIANKNGPLTVFLSERDYKLLEKEEIESLLIMMDASLTEGDIIIKSHAAEISALLDERINQLVRIEHD